MHHNKPSPIKTGQWDYEKSGLEELKLRQKESLQRQADQVYECVPWTEYKHRAFDTGAKVNVPQIRRIQGDFKYEKSIRGPPPSNPFHYHMQDWTLANYPQPPKKEETIHNNIQFGQPPQYNPYNVTLPESRRVVGFTHINPCIRQPTYLQQNPPNNTTLTPEDFQDALSSARNDNSHLNYHAGQRSRWTGTIPHDHSYSKNLY